MVEVIGGIEPARSLILSALEGGASVVTANKSLLAEDGATLFTAAEKYGADLYYEAAVAGAIPLLRPLRESLAGDRVRRVMGIVNGTTNFILTRMTESGAGFADALEEAQALGYAEADPTADVEGFDAAAKAAILAALAFHTRVTAADVHREGITEVTSADVSSAREMGCVVKLLAIAELSEDGTSIGVRAHPAMIPLTHPLASVREAFNAVFVECEAAGELMFYGRGAGGAPTASAVLGDVVAVARHKVSGGRGPGESAYADLRVRPMGETTDPLPREPRRRRPLRCPGQGRDRVRRARGVHRDGPAGEARQRRRRARDRHPRGERRCALGDGRGAARARRRTAGAQRDASGRSVRAG